MIVERYTYHVKMGKEQDAADLIKRVMGLVSPWEAYRVYRPSIGPLEVVAIETEYSGFAQRQEWMANLRASPEFP